MTRTCSGTLTATALSISVLLATSGCGSLGADRPSDPPQTGATMPDPTPSAAVARPAPPHPAGVGGGEPALAPDEDAVLDSPAAATGSRNLTELFLADQPAGTGPEIALRFLQALQDGDDLAAAYELYIAGRSLLAGRGDPIFLSRVMRDVASNAGLDNAGPCASAQALTAESAVVLCGRRHVVVHVLSDPDASGVQISERHPAVDRYGKPHTHAFTSIEL